MSPTYEMLWDCEYCGAKRLLASTHRYCPNCGGKQKAEWRYYPSDAEKVEAKDHVFAGTDRICPACGVPNSARANNCRGCGAALAGAAEVRTRQDQVQEGPSFAGETVADAKRELAEAKAGGPPPPPARAGGRRVWLIAGLVLAVLVAIGIAASWKKEVHARVAGHSWRREIRIETLGPVSDQAWCDSMPAGAYRVSRHREVRSHRSVPDGEVCQTVRHDNGDGTFSESQRCRPKYREEPIYDDRCRYVVDRWHPVRTAVAQGASLGERPAWPVTGMVRAGNCLGCEREGSRSAEYVVQFQVQGKVRDCKFDEARWSGLADGSEWKVKVGALTGALDCSTLQPVR